MMLSEAAVLVEWMDLASGLLSDIAEVLAANRSRHRHVVIPASHSPRPRPLAAQPA